MLYAQKTGFSTVSAGEPLELTRIPKSMSNLPDFSSYGYAVIRELGHNRFGGRVTYLVTETSTGQPRVIKQFQFAKSNSDWSGFKAFEREIQVLQGLNHPGIPQYLYSFEASDGFCMVQEYKNAQPLAVPRSFSADEIKQIAIAILEILVYLQSRIPAVIHRDIKPENILVDQLNSYLVDFGFARVGSGDVALSSVVTGTPGFMPPEQLLNLQLTEASDLYGLGTTLICLLTGTKSVEVGKLIDSSYRINFKHLVPKLSLRYIEWLEKMVQPNLNQRFPNAEVALEALKPLYVTRLPAVKLDQSSWQFWAINLGEKLSQTITLSNPVPETVLEGTWEVAPHPSDPPHTPDSHSWIAIKPAKFKANRAECRIMVDTGQLMADKLYERQLLLHTNSSPETHVLNIKVRTASILIEVKNLPHVYIAVVFVFSFASAAMVAALVGAGAAAVVGAVSGAFAAAVVGAIAGIGLGFGVRAGTWVGAIAGVFAGAVAVVGAGAWSGALVVLVMGAIAGALAGTVFGVWTEAVFAAVDYNFVRRGFSERFAIAVLLLTIASAVSLGTLSVGFFNPFVISILAVTGLPLATILVHQLINHRRLIAKYRQSEQNLIKP